MELLQETNKLRLLLFKNKKKKNYKTNQDNVLFLPKNYE